MLDFASYNGGMEEKQFAFLIIYLAKENTMQLQTCRALYLFTLILMAEQGKSAGIMSLAECLCVLLHPPVTSPAKTLCNGASQS